MPDILLKDILIGARQESYRMRHFYVGTEHLFTALLEIKGSLASNIIQEHGLTPEYVIDAIRRKIGKGSKHRLWAGVPNTPRATVILGIANDIALENNHEEINERDLLIALFEENDSIPMRVLNSLGLSNAKDLAKMAREYTVNSDSQRPYIKIDFGPAFNSQDELPKEQLFILRRMFHGYNQIRIDRRLTGGYSQAALLVVTPIQLDKQEDAPVVVKINQADIILDEAQRYESHVKTRLPAMTARLEEKPVAPKTSDLAALKYTLVAGTNQTPHDLQAVLNDWDAKKLGAWIKGELYPVFGRIWWQQKRPYRFQVWREYDWMLPPILTLEIVKDKPLPADGFTIRMPIKGSRLKNLEYGSIVAVENFIVQKVNHERNSIRLAIGTNSDITKAYNIEVRNVDLTKTTYYRGEVIDKLVARVWQTRAEYLLHALRDIEPDFDARANTFPVGKYNLPNPIIAYEDLLEKYMNGSLSTIHGDLHPGNIMIGPNESAFLIDFAHTREGHTVFDWANLESSLLCDTNMAQTNGSWKDAYKIIEQLLELNKSIKKPETIIDDSLSTIVQIRSIVKECLISNDKWSEYFIALTFCGLRGFTWNTLSKGGRRLMFLIAGLALYELQIRSNDNSATDTPSPEETDVSDSF